MAQIDEIIAYTDDQLLERLGRELVSAEFGAGDAQRFIRLGRAWFETQATKLRDDICIAPPVVAILAEGQEYSHLLEVVAIVEALAQTIDENARFLFAVLLVRRGLSRYCGLI